MTNPHNIQSLGGSSLQAQFLFQPVKCWTSEHLQAAKLEIVKNAAPVNILTPEYLPLDGDEGMAALFSRGLHGLKRNVDFEPVALSFCKSFDDLSDENPNPFRIDLIQLTTLHHENRVWQLRFLEQVMTGSSPS